MENFKKEWEAGYVCEEQIIRVLRDNAITPADNIFMFNHGFNVADILNGRVNENEVPMQELKDMINSWNKKLGFDIIFGAYV